MIVGSGSNPMTRACGYLFLKYRIDIPMSLPQSMISGSAALASKS